MQELDNNLKNVVNEFVDRLTTVENEISLLRQDRKDIIDEFRDKIDVKTFTAALRIAKIREKINDENLLDAMVNTIEAEDE